MEIIICPGIHHWSLTQSFVAGLQLASDMAVSPVLQNLLVFPAHEYPAYSSWHILEFLRKYLSHPADSPLIFISFSAGVVGAIGAAWGWQLLGGQIKAFIAIDGWGVPLLGFPIYRVSHDNFTHWSSALLGSGEDSFYADPPVEHLEIWRSPQSVHGWWLKPTSGTKPPTYLTVAQFLTTLLQRYSVEEGIGE